jgi:hypothetical protein
MSKFASPNLVSERVVKQHFEFKAASYYGEKKPPGLVTLLGPTSTTVVLEGRAISWKNRARSLGE